MLSGIQTKPGQMSKSLYWYVCWCVPYATHTRRVAFSVQALEEKHDLFHLVVVV